MNNIFLTIGWIEAIVSFTLICNLYAESFGTVEIKNTASVKLWQYLLWMGALVFWTMGFLVEQEPAYATSLWTLVLIFYILDKTKGRKTWQINSSLK